ncbi:UDP-N-acetylmuramoyl-tripeptide--D-alanyl-D-alanine ligase [Carboxylicivirga sp. N1Y90]|uniref:UDP-N-acetylmuramoyl-tripeptide--D-alanyl-D- alanine ligase n=1 Tax=Carboxylicivirga fragile TaxID=3417571 RepID=UPI003D327A9B|nr:UDP-N-acetylmuramoyl-tripeptide--D-alanyl-D-alanine ligase [Marinilabiliaceae bacterium N1Y90]
MSQLEDIYKAFLQSSSISTDSRKCEKNSMFVALKGDRFDGNKYVKDVLAKGAAFAIASDQSLVGMDNVFVVDDTLETLQALANHHRRKLNIPIIAITGTNGKTTTKELLAAVLSKKYRIKATAGNFNNHIGVPLTLLSMDENVELGVVEMGANHVNEIDLLCEIAEPNYGLITNVGKAHLEGFGSFEGVRKAKGEMYDYIASKNGLIFINRGNAYLMEMAEEVDRRFYYGKNGIVQASLTAVNPFVSLDWELEDEGLLSNVDTKLIGGYNLENILAAIAVGSYFKVEKYEINKAIADYTPSNNRSQFIKTKNNRIIMDAYNANPSSMEVALENFNEIEEANKVIVIGGMKEMGEDSNAEHAKLLSLIQSGNYEKVILIGEEFNDNALTPNMRLFPDNKSLILSLQSEKLSDSYILIKGSRSNKLEEILPYL